MKKLIFAVLTVLSFSFAAFAARDFIEGTDYFSDFMQNEDGFAAALHINFTGSEPTPQEAETVLKDQLKIYGKILEDEKAAKQKEEEEAAKEKAKSQSASLAPDEEEKEEKFKNIIGSVWFAAKADNPVKIKFNDYLASYVYIGKTKKIIPFTDYITFLKKERDDKKAKEKLKASAEKAAEIKTDFQE